MWSAMKLLKAITQISNNSMSACFHAKAYLEIWNAGRHPIRGFTFPLIDLHSSKRMSTCIPDSKTYPGIKAVGYAMN